MNPVPVAIRLNPFKGCDGPDGTSVPWSPYGRILQERPAFTLDPLFHAGCYYVQDSSAMYVGHVFRKNLGLVERGDRPLRVLDLCAAPGGKTTDLSVSLRERCADNFILVSNEVMKARSAVLCDNVAMWGDPNVIVTSVDPAAFAQMGAFFDVILADVPCSGEGMFRKDPKALEQWSENTVELCAARQKRILADVWPALRQGGVLIYSTCTYEERENDINLSWAGEVLGGEVLPVENEFERYGVRSTPCGNLLKAGETPGEGQWVGALVKTSGQKTGSSDLKALRPLVSGPRRGEMKGKDFIPDPEWPLSIAFDRKAYPEIEVDTLTALHFLHQDSITLPDAPVGYNVLTYRGHPLGFVKNLGKRCNNLHPRNRRIFMDIK